MSVAIDIFERMFEYEEMPAASASHFAAPAAGPRAVETIGGSAPLGSARAATIQGASNQAASISELQSRIQSMQATKLGARTLPTNPAIASLLPGGGLQEGSVYSVAGSGTLLMALLAEPSRAGEWCGVVGVPEFGVEAASRFGVDLERLVLIPQPGDQWLAVAAAIADVLKIVVMRPPKKASDGAISRLAARLRQRGSTLIVLGSWPHSEAMISVSDSDWSGIGEGFGHLASRQATVTVTSKLSGRPRSARLWLPSQSEQFERVEHQRRPERFIAPAAHAEFAEAAG